jgi:hypothetical protein
MQQRGDLDDDEPIDNGPRSVITEGHEIISQERLVDHWQVVIEKKYSVSSEEKATGCLRCRRYPMTGRL